MLATSLIIAIKPLARLLITLFLILPLHAAEKTVYDVRSFGATGDGVTMDTKALQTCINTAGGAGGGFVRFPPGRYLTGSLYLRSGITLELQKDAVLLGSTNKLDYYRAAKNGRLNFHGLLLGHQLTGISVIGEGTIDGQGTALAQDTVRLAREGVIPDAKEGQRPMIIHFRDCCDITIRGITLRDSACWTQEYRNCDRLTIDNITVRTRAWRNNDGIDIDGCSDVTVRRCDIDSEDDGICLKSVERPCKNVLVEHCRVRSSCNALKLGTASEKGFSNITFRDCEVYDTYLSGLALECVDGGLLENVTAERIRITGTQNAIFIRLGQRNIKGLPGTLRNVVLSDITVEIPDLPWPQHMTKFSPGHTYRHPKLITASITGLPGHPVKGVTLRNLTLIYGGIGAVPATGHLRLDQLDQVPECRETYPESRMFGILPAWGFYCRHVQDLTFTNVTLKVTGKDYRPALVMDDLQALTLDGLRIQSAGSSPVIVLKDVNGAIIRNSPPPAGTKAFLSTQGTTRDVIRP